MAKGRVSSSGHGFHAAVIGPRKCRRVAEEKAKQRHGYISLHLVFPLWGNPFPCANPWPNRHWQRHSEKACAAKGPQDLLSADTKVIFERERTVELGDPR